MNKKLFVVFLAIALMGALTACSDHSGGSTGRGTAGFAGVEEAPGDALPDTPDDQLTGLSIGDSVTLGGVTLTIDSIEDGPADAKSETWKIHVSYLNHGGRMLTVSPFDWVAVLPDGSETQYDMDDKGNFEFATVAEEKRYSGNLLIYKEGNPIEIKYIPTQPWTDKVPVWKIP
ncbi:MAG: hypothetical protein LBS91_07385 [Clostridiales Family XIII bacterium]|jgi:hypothetical protein|nr:hypothetical protein [Clostridiales Family XIII bacterium]